MSSVNYEDFIPDVLPMVPGCTDILVVQHIRAAAIELCEKSYFYHEDLDPVTVVPGIYEYDLDVPRNTVAHKLLWAVLEGRYVEFAGSALMAERYPNWREKETRGKPKLIAQVRPDAFWLCPIPQDKVKNGLIIHAVLKPTRRSTSIEERVAEECHDAIVNGALFRLLRLPSKDWTDLGGAKVYGALFQDGIREAEVRGRNADTPIARKTKYGGLPIRNGARKVVW